MAIYVAAQQKWLEKKVPPHSITFCSKYILLYIVSGIFVIFFILNDLSLRRDNYIFYETGGFYYLKSILDTL